MVLAVALIAASAASYGVYRAIASRPTKLVEMPTAYAVVAATNLPVGTLLTVDSVKRVPWPERTPIKGGFTTVEEVVNRGLVTMVAENEPLTEPKLAPKGAGAGLPPTITPGMRAMSVSVNEVIGVAGFVVPGTHVDVVTVITDDNVNRDGTISRVVVSNVTVLSAGTRYDQEEAQKEGKAIRSTVVTLMVTPVDAERIALAQAKGQLMLALRNPTDVEPAETNGVRQAALFADASAPARPVAPVAAPVRRTPVVRAVAEVAPAPRAYTVETIRAAKRADEVVK